MKRITTRAELTELARELGVRPDWHEPDEQDVTAVVRGTSFDNAMGPGEAYGGGPPDVARTELHVTLLQNATPVAVVSLATLFAWATGYQSDQPDQPQRAARADASDVLYRWRDRYRRQAREATSPTDRTINVILADAFERAAEQELGIAESKERHPSGRLHTARCSNDACGVLLTERSDILELKQGELLFRECRHCGRELSEETVRRLGL